MLHARMASVLLLVGLLAASIQTSTATPTSVRCNANMADPCAPGGKCKPRLPTKAGIDYRCLCTFGWKKFETSTGPVCVALSGPKPTPTPTPTPAPTPAPAPTPVAVPAGPNPCLSNPCGNLNWTTTGVFCIPPTPGTAQNFVYCGCFGGWVDFEPAKKTCHKLGVSPPPPSPQPAAIISISPAPPPSPAPAPPSPMYNYSTFSPPNPASPPSPPPSPIVPPNFATGKCLYGLGIVGNTLDGFRNIPNVDTCLWLCSLNADCQYTVFDRVRGDCYLQANPLTGFTGTEFISDPNQFYTTCFLPITEDPNFDASPLFFQPTPDFLCMITAGQAPSGVITVTTNPNDFWYKGSNMYKERGSNDVIDLFIDLPETAAECKRDMNLCSYFTVDLDLQTNVTYKARFNFFSGSQTLYVTTFPGNPIMLSHQVAVCFPLA